MDENNFNTVNAVQENVVDSQTTEQSATVEPVNAGSEEVASPQTETKPVQDSETNRIYAEARRKAEAEAQRTIDAEYDRLYGAEYGIHSKADYDKYIADMEKQQQVQAEAAKYNASPEFLAYVKSLEEKVNTIEQDAKTKEEAAQKEAFNKEIESQLNEVLELSKKEGFEVTKEQLLNAAIENQLGDLKKVYKLIKPDLDMETLKQNAVKEYIENLKKGAVPVEASGTSPAVITETPKSFEDARKGAAAMLKASKIFNN